MHGVGRCFTNIFSVCCNICTIVLDVQTWLMINVCMLKCRFKKHVLIRQSFFLPLLWCQFVCFENMSPVFPLCWFSQAEKLLNKTQVNKQYQRLQAEPFRVNKDFFVSPVIICNEEIMHVWTFSSDSHVHSHQAYEWDLVSSMHLKTHTAGNSISISHCWCFCHEKKWFSKFFGLCRKNIFWWGNIDPERGGNQLVVNRDSELK